MLEKDSRQSVKEFYKSLAKVGPYACQAPLGKGNAKSRYIAKVFDVAIFESLDNLKQRERVLDYGCGTGLLTIQLLDYFSQVIGIDITEELLNVANQLKPDTDRIQFKTTNGQEILFDSNFFDVVITRDCLCHVLDDSIVNIVGEIYRVLRNGGRFVWLEQVSESSFWRKRPNAPYVLKRSVDEIIEIVKTRGFVIKNLKTVKKPRFFWTYLIQLGIVPFSLFENLARTEVRFNKKFFPVRTNRWHYVMFEFEKA